MVGLDPLYLFLRKSPFNFFGQLFGEYFPDEHQGISIRQTAHIVVKGFVFPAPDLFGFPVQFQQDVRFSGRLTYADLGFYQGLAANKQVATGKKVTVARLKIGNLPLMNHTSILTKKINGISADGRCQRVTSK